MGDLKTNRKLEWKGGIIKASDLAASIPAADRKEMRIGDKRQWYFTVTVQIPEVKHKVRIVVLWHYRKDEACCKILVTNRSHLGSESDRAGVPAALDGHGDIPSGRQAATRAG